MKYPLLLLLAFIACGAANAKIISGRIEDKSTCGPAAGLMIVVRDSAEGSGRMTWKDSIATDADGTFSFNVPAYVPTSQNYFVLAFKSCAVPVRIQIPGSTTEDILHEDYAICGQANQLYSYPRFNYAGPLDPRGEMKLYLIRKDYDASISDTVLTAIDSVYDSRYSVFPFTKACIPGGKLLVKAMLLPSHPLFGSYIPTYFGDTLRWSGAREIQATDWNGLGLDISMIAAANPGGPGFIGGAVRAGANKRAAAGDPLSGRLLLLTTDNDVPVAASHSDASGQYAFTDLPYGSYKVFGEIFGKKNILQTVTLSQSAPRAEHLDFEESSKRFGPAGSNLSVGKPNSADITISPNPALAQINIAGLGSFSGEKMIAVYSVTGAILMRQQIPAQSSDYSLKVDLLAPGSYIVRVTGPTQSFNAVMTKR
jgi:hypothetical protein